MNTKVVSLLVILGGAVDAVALIDFEDLSAPVSGGAPIADGYMGVSWSGSVVYNSSTHFGVGSISLSAATGGINSAFNSAPEFRFSLTAGGLFDFRSGIFTSLHSSQNLTIDAIRGGVVVGTMPSVFLDSATVETIVFDPGFYGIDEVRFTSSNPNQVAFDNLDIAVVPEPSVLALAGIAVVGATFVRRGRSRPRSPPGGVAPSNPVARVDG